MILEDKLYLGRADQAADQATIQALGTDTDEEKHFINCQEWKQQPNYYNNKDEFECVLI